MKKYPTFLLQTKRFIPILENLKKLGEKLETTKNKDEIIKLLNEVKKNARRLLTELEFCKTIYKKEFKSHELDQFIDITEAIIQLSNGTIESIKEGDNTRYKYTLSFLIPILKNIQTDIEATIYINELIHNR